MELTTLKAVLELGDKHGSAIKEMLSDLKICDLVNVTEEQAQMWLVQKRGEEDDIRDNK